MSKSQIYEDFTNKNSISRLLFDFLLEQGMSAENAKIGLKMTVSFVINNENVEFPIPSELSIPQIQHILEMTGNSFADFESYAVQRTKRDLEISK